ncbi:MAG: ABC transporter ATP-binding protein [Chloroflexota bacterium]
MASISLEHVSKRYGEIEAVRDFSLDIADGEFMVFVGPSGCGKTTALRLIAGLERPDAGVVRMNGEIVNDVAPAERDVAMVFEDFALYPHMKVHDNLAFPLRMRKTPAEAIRRRVAEVADATEIEPILGRKPGDLATGEAQHVAVGHAVVREVTSVFLLDDALSHLDAHQRLEARAELARLHRELGATIVAVTHDQAEALAVGTRVAVMADGRLRQAATPRWLYERPADTFVAGFIGNPPMNLVEMDVEPEDDGHRLQHGALGWSVPASMPLRHFGQGETVIVGFRPEHIRVGAPPNPDEIGFEATCDLVEYLGHRRLVHLHTGDALLVASIEPADALTVGDAVACAIPTARLRFFDTQTGRALE